MNRHRNKQHDTARQTLIPGAGKADIHTHTNASDGKPSPMELLKHVEEKTDLDVIAVTDHDTTTGALEAQKLHEQGDYRFDLIVGQEVTSRAGHIIALFIEKPIPKERSAEETVRLIHEQGGLAIAAHPLLTLKHIDPDMLTADGVGVDTLMSIQFDGVEIINGSPLMKDENTRTRMLNRTVIFRAETGGSDAHIKEAVGKGYTLFPGRTAQDFRKAVEQKTTEAVSTTYRARELLKYVRFFGKMKIREFGKKAFGKIRKVRPRTAKS
ncbi:PHP domain-containing protein [Patescibacteria group bacterium]|nr:PHP domain-containing protein [Patescibacteria group bacterium]